MRKQTRKQKLLQYISFTDMDGNRKQTKKRSGAFADCNGEESAVDDEYHINNNNNNNEEDSQS